MAKLEKSLRREEARERARRGMRTVGRSVFTIERRLGERATQAKEAGTGRVKAAGRARRGQAGRLRK